MTATVAFLDERNRSPGGIASINNDMERSGLAGGWRVVRSGLRHLDALLAQEKKSGAPLVCIFDEASTWMRLPLVLRAAVRRRIHWPAGVPCRFVLREHHYSEGFVEHCVARRWGFERMLKLTYGAMDAVVAVSDGQHEWLRRRRLCAVDKLSVLKHAVGVEALLQRDASPRRSPLVFGSFGRFVPQKGFDLLLDAWKGLPITCGASLVIGGSGALESEIRQRAGELRNVTVVGACSALDFFSQCDVVIIPSRYEPFGQICLEARAAGKPIIASAVDGLPEQVNGCGATYPTGDLAALGGCILSMLSMAGQAEFERMVNHGRTSASRERASYVASFAHWINALISFESVQ